MAWSAGRKDGSFKEAAGSMSRAVPTQQRDNVTWRRCHTLPNGSRVGSAGEPAEIYCLPFASPRRRHQGPPKQIRVLLRTLSIAQCQRLLPPRYLLLLPPFPTSGFLLPPYRLGFSFLFLPAQLLPFFVFLPLQPPHQGVPPSPFSFHPQVFALPRPWKKSLKPFLFIVLIVAL